MDVKGCSSWYHQKCLTEALDPQTLLRVVGGAASQAFSPPGPLWPLQHPTVEQNPEDSPHWAGHSSLALGAPLYASFLVIVVGQHQAAQASEVLCEGVPATALVLGSPCGQMLRLRNPTPRYVP